MTQRPAKILVAVYRAQHVHAACKERERERSSVNGACCNKFVPSVRNKLGSERDMRLVNFHRSLSCYGHMVQPLAPYGLFAKSLRSRRSKPRACTQAALDPSCPDRKQLRASVARHPVERRRVRVYLPCVRSSLFCCV